MDFGLSLDTDISFSKKTSYVHKFSDQLNAFFSSKKYGDDIKSLTVGLIIKPPQFDAFYKEKKPKYYQGKNSIANYGITIEIENAFEYSIKPNYMELISADEDSILKNLAPQILKSLDKIDSVRKIKNFDKERFKADLESFFKERDLI